jgi:hypothetical protein
MPRLRAIFTGGNQDLETQRATPLEWLTLVEMYTNCGLTRKEDKLIAIMGIAKKIQSHTRDI